MSKAEQKMSVSDAKLLLYQISDMVYVAAKFLEAENETESVQAAAVLKAADDVMEKLMNFLEELE